MNHMRTKKQKTIIQGLEFKITTAKKTAIKKKGLLKNKKNFSACLKLNMTFQDFNLGILRERDCEN